MQPFFTSNFTSTLGGQFALKKGGQFDRIFHTDLKINAQLPQSKHNFPNQGADLKINVPI